MSLGFCRRRRSIAGALQRLKFGIEEVHDVELDVDDFLELFLELAGEFELLLVAENLRNGFGNFLSDPHMLVVPLCIFGDFLHI